MTDDALLNAWIDFTGDGDWLDSGEQILVDQAVTSGTQTFEFDVPLAAAEGLTFARFRLSTTDGLSPHGPAPDGEVEDHRVDVFNALPLDFGDAPGPHPTTLAENGARHRVLPGGPVLGTQIDEELNGHPDVAAAGDNEDGVDDEDGVTFLDDGLAAGSTADVQIEATADALLSAWIDFDLDGDWADAGEQIFADWPVTAGINVLTFDAPPDLVEGTRYARFRLSTIPGLSYDGDAPDGEVEDYRLLDNKGPRITGVAVGGTSWSSQFINRASGFTGDLLTNGSFEQGPAISSWTGLQEGSTAIHGWTVTRGRIDYIGPSYWESSDGSYSVDLDGGPSFAGIAQTFTTEIGAAYIVTFDMAGNPGGPPVVKSLEVNAAGQSGDFTFDTSGSSSANMGWMRKEWQFTAADTHTTIEFRSTDTINGYFGPAIDNVVVRELGTAEIISGHSIPVGSQAQVAPIPWRNVDQITILFDENVALPLPNLQIDAAGGGSYVAGTASYDEAARAATWTLNTALATERLTLTLDDGLTDMAGNLLDGEWADGESAVSGDRAAGGDFVFTLNCLPGDVDQNGTVEQADEATVRGSLGAFVGHDPYPIMQDLDGNGFIVSNDVLFARSRVGDELPVVPTSTATATTSVSNTTALPSILGRLGRRLPAGAATGSLLDRLRIRAQTASESRLLRLLRRNAGRGGVQTMFEMSNPDLGARLMARRLRGADQVDGSVREVHGTLTVV